MLNSIKAMINRKEEFLESASIILEDATESSMIDLIILNEASDDNELMEENEPQEDTPPEESEIGDEDIPEEDSNDGDDLMSSNIDDSTPDPDDENNDGENNMMDDGTGLPDIAGRQTGEPIHDDVEDLLNVQIDLKTNTMTDVLPVPPSGAAEAIEGDILDARVDSGFGEEETVPEEPEGDTSEPPAEDDAGFGQVDDILDSQIDESGKTEDDDSDDEKGKGAKEKVPEKEDKAIQEAISFDDEPVGEEPPVEDGESPPAEGEESEVTAAVKDKVAEADIQEPLTDGVSNSDNGKEALLKKLGSITKSIEDAKKSVMDYLQ